MKTAGYRKTREELMDELSDQLEFLASSAARYDEGKLNEAKRLANAVYTLIYDGKGKTVSLCTRLGLLPEMRLLSTCPEYEGKGKGWVSAATPLTHLEMGGSMAPRAVPRCCSEREPMFSRWLPASKWLSEQISNPGTPTLSRRNLIHSIRSQDGGSHSDAELTETGYVALRSCGLGPNMALQYGGKKVPLQGAAAASMRQIAWEVERSIIEHIANEDHV